MEELKVGGSTVRIVSGIRGSILPEREGRRRVAIITQPGASQHAVRISRFLKDGGLDVDVLGVPDRDEAKTLAVAATLYERFSRIGLGREDTVVGVGGGAVTDLAGFVAGTWMRGVEVVHFPTTLLAAVDASIGGKTGVNHIGKNLVGVFWDPTLVVIDLDILDKLPTALVREGMAEALKAGLVGDAGLVELIEAHGIDAPLDKVVPAAVKVKARYVGDDPRDVSGRAMLNFGHTVGHAVEYASSLSHGSAVGVGMVAAAAVSEADVGFVERSRVVEAIARTGLATSVEGLDRTRVRDLIGVDKKRDRNGVRMVLLEAVGKPTLRHADEGSIDLALRAIGL
ncbi:MAG: 3-dehydroquinate synthase family protein [Acidimicrobiia bacterium]